MAIEHQFVFFPHLVKQMQDIILVSAFTSKLFILPSGKLT